MKSHAIAVSLSLVLTGVFATPPGASAQFDLDLQATEIGNQLQQILNRITRYTTLLSQFTRLDCSAQGMGGRCRGHSIERGRRCLRLPRHARRVQRFLPAAPSSTGGSAPYRPASSRLARRIASRGHGHRGRHPERLPGRGRRCRGGDLRAPRELRGSQCGPGPCRGRCHGRTHRHAGRGHGRCCGIFEARNSVTTTGMAQARVAATLTRARVLVALSQLRAHQTSIQAADAYNAEVARRQIEAHRLANRAALETQWAQERADVAARTDERIESMYGGYQLPSVFNQN